MDGTFQQESNVDVIISAEKGSNEAKEYEEYPDGGWPAWRTVIGAWLVLFCTYGYINAFGVFQDFYVRHFLSSESASAIGWIGGIQLLLMMSAGLVSGQLFDRGYSREILLAGSLLHSFSMFMLSLAKPNHFYQVFLSQGLGAGLGMGVTYVPGIGLVSQYFSRRRSLALSTAATGAATGGILHPIMLNNLIHHAGFHTAVRISAGFITALLAIALCLLRPRLPIRTNGKSNGYLQNAKKFARDKAWLFTTFGTFFAGIGCILPLFYTQLLAVKRGINPTLAFYALSIMNASSVPGRIVPGHLADRYGVFNVVCTDLALMGAVCAATVAVRSAAGVVCYAIAYGIVSGTYFALIPVLFATTADDSSEIGQRLGIGLVWNGVGEMVGSPIAGALLTSRYRWWRPSIFSGITLILASILLFMARHFLARRRESPLV